MTINAMDKLKTISLSNAEHYQWGDQCDGWHLVKSPTLSVIRESVPAGRGESMHYHRNSEQFFYVLSGIATITVDGVDHKLGSGEGLEVRPGSIHRLSNQQKVDLEFIVTSTPPSHGDRVDVCEEGL